MTWPKPRLRNIPTGMTVALAVMSVGIVLACVGAVLRGPQHATASPSISAGGSVAVSPSPADTTTPPASTTTPTPRPKPTPSPTPTRTTSPPKPTPTVTPTQQGITPGAFCAPQGAYGIGKRNGHLYRCEPAKVNQQLRWERA